MASQTTPDVSVPAPPSAQYAKKPSDSNPAERMAASSSLGLSISNSRRQNGGHSAALKLDQISARSSKVTAGAEAICLTQSIAMPARELSHIFSVP